MPTADIKANGSNGPITIAYNTAATISWTSTNASSCTVSPAGWTGTSGSASTGNLTSSKTYTLSCTGAGGSASDSVVVNVSSPPPPPGSTPPPPGGSTTPSPIAGVPTLPPPPISIPGAPVKIDPNIVNFLKINLSIPYLTGSIKVPLLIGGFGQELEVTPGTKDYEVDVRGAKFKLGTQLKIQAGGAHTLLTKKITLKTKAPKQPVNFGDLWLGDLKVDNQVNFQDTEKFLTSFIEKNIEADVNADGIANSLDWAIILANFGKRGD
ncbi:MAG: hypothetical protein A2Z11_04065 [Candidatus Woykebacteria bacterium RBG_16_43_9]|uniref:Dockerin domain-containing protein n=1 Tax=Candidatus Woykebacteria bacterium RBG_16_43_9 TaxID=1802596 RepID=A0A1G1WEC0_9BACT|nr:MAG: hypothetical protein A2Z11_04065 [Candidatus Woykebacteria bacterium RBG_16_43_9]